MFRYFLKTVQGRIIGLFVVFVTLTFGVSIYTTRYISRSAIEGEKSTKLAYVASYQDRQLGDGDYRDILNAAGAADAPREEQIAVLNRELAARTDELAALFPGLGVGYYSLELDAILSYGPSAEYADRVGVSIGADHPGRTVMAQNRDMVQNGTMVRGHIMNAMHAIVRKGAVIGYAWANELTSEIQTEYEIVADRITIFLAVLCAVFMGMAVVLSRRMTQDIGTVITDIKRMRNDLSTRVRPVGGELGEIAISINDMATAIEMNAREHEELLMAEAANAAQRDFLSRMSHEMRTPMNAVLGMATIARKSGDPARVRDCLNKIHDAATHLLGVINDVLDMSKIEAGHLELSETRFAFRDMLNQAVTVSEFKIGEKSQKFYMEVAEDVPAYVTTDRQRLAQVVTNLLSNATKFTPEGGHIWLRVKRAETETPDEAAAKVLTGRARLRVEVRDEGIGISEEQQARLFRSFEQADNSISRKYGGTGLGLAISKRIIELMNGRIWIESKLGHGASFIFEIEVPGDALGEAIPVNEETEPLAAPERLPLLPPGGESGILAGKRILLAEDVDINREIVQALLEPTEAAIDCAENGIQALRMFSAAPEAYDMILMDVQMPEMDGYEATRRIRALPVPQAGTVPILAMTANVFREDIERCLEAGMNGHVGKPLDFDEVLAQLRHWIK